MPIIEYMLLAFLGTAGAATPGGTPGGPLTRTFTANAVTQPNGGTAGLLGQAGGSTGGQERAETGKKGRSHLKASRHQRSSIALNPQPLPPRKSPHLEARRYHPKGHRHSKVTGPESRVSSSTPGTGGVKPNMNAQPRPPRPRRASNSNKNSK
jgi:hypothetical protein